MSIPSFFFLIEIQSFLLSLHIKVDDRSCRITRCGSYAIPLPLNVIQCLRNVIIFTAIDTSRVTLGLIVT